MQRKNTRQKQAIKEVLQATRSHPTAEWIYTRVKTMLPNISMGTIYRNLKTLRDDGEILEIFNYDGLGRFDAETRDHYHFKCNLCNSIADINMAVEPGLDAEVARKTGLKISCHRIEFYGICPECYRKTTREGKDKGDHNVKSSNIA